MIILYCDACGVLVSEEDLNNGRGGRRAHLVYCQKCAPAHVPKKQPGSGIHTIPKKKASGILASPVSRATSSVSAQSTHASSRRDSRGGSLGIVIGAVGIVLILLSLVILNAASGNKGSSAHAGNPAATTKTNDAPAQTNGNSSSVPTKVGTDVARTEPKRPDTGVEDIRENFARRQWIELKFDVDRSPTAWTIGKRVKDFAVANSNTQAGKEAAEYLKTMKNPVAQPPGPNVFAVYSRDFKGPEPATGWRYLWNKDGAIGNSSKYAPLQWNGGQGAYSGDANNYPAEPPLACAQLSNGFGHPGSGVDNNGGGFDRFVIAAYTLQREQRGKTAIEIGLTYTRKDVSGGKIELRVYVNDTLQGAMPIASNPAENQISAHLGDLKEGDTIYFCVGPDREDASDSFAFRFTIYPVP